MQWIEHPDFEALTATVSRSLAGIGHDAIAARGQATLALAGGSTPLPVYHHLAGQSLDFSRVTLVPGDERWVAHDSHACNLRAIRQAFAGTGSSLRALTPEDPGPEPSLDTARETLAGLALPFDACVLGMGADGHFASLFPGAPELEQALDINADEPVVIVRPDPLPEEAPFPRISLTLAPIVASRRILLLIRGESKRAALKTALETGDPARYPVAALVANGGPPVEVHWSP